MPVEDLIGCAAESNLDDLGGGELVDHESCHCNPSRCDFDLVESVGGVISRWNIGARSGVSSMTPC